MPFVTEQQTSRSPQRGMAVAGLSFEVARGRIAVLLGHNFPASTWYFKAYEIVEGPLPRHIRPKGGGIGRLNPFG